MTGVWRMWCLMLAQSCLFTDKVLGVDLAAIWLKLKLSQVVTDSYLVHDVIYSPGCLLSIAGLILHSPITSGLRVLTDNRLFACFDIFPNINRINKVICPVFIIHGVVSTTHCCGEIIFIVYVFIYFVQRDMEVDVSHGKQLQSEGMYRECGCCVYRLINYVVCMIFV